MLKSHYTSGMGRAELLDLDCCVEGLGRGEPLGYSKDAHSLSSQLQMCSCDNTRELKVGMKGIDSPS